MTKTQQTNLNEVVFSLSVEGFDIPKSEKDTLIEVLEGKRTYHDVLSDYITEAQSYAGVWILLCGFRILLLSRH